MIDRVALLKISAALIFMWKLVENGDIIKVGRECNVKQVYLETVGFSNNAKFKQLIICVVFY